MGNIKLQPGDKAFRGATREAHTDGRHGPDDGPVDVLEWWAGICSDCHARWRYEVKG